MMLIYTLYISILLFFSAISNITHTLDLTVKPKQKVTFKFVDDNNVTKKYNLEALRTSVTFNNMFKDLEVTNNQIVDIPNLHAKQFYTIYQGMKQLITKESESTKQRLIHAIYKDKTPLELIPILSTVNKQLDIPLLTQALTTCIAQKTDLLSGQEQSNFLKTIHNQLDEQELAKNILAYITTITPTLKAVPLSASDYSENTDVFSPCKKLKINPKNGDIIVCSSNRLFLQQDRGDYFFDESCVFSPQDNYMLYTMDKKTARLVTLNKAGSITEGVEIKNIIWYKNQRYGLDPRACFNDKRTCFNNDGTRLLIHTYDQEDTDNKQFIGERFTIIDTSTAQLKKIIDSKNIDDICFCNTNKLCIQYIADKNYTLSLMNSDDSQFTPFYSVIKHAFDATQETLIICSHDLDNNSTTVKIHDIGENESKEITLNSMLKNISIVINKNNNDFLICGKDKDSVDQVFLCNTKEDFSTQLTSFTNTEWLNLRWSASGDYIIYDYMTPDPNQDYPQKKTIGYISATTVNPQKIDLIKEKKHACLDINPYQDIIYILSSAESRSGPLHMYNLSSQVDLIAHYSATHFRITRTGSLRRPTEYLNADGKLLLMSTDQKWFVINTKTNTTVVELPEKNHRVYWKNEQLVIEKWNTSLTGSSGYTLDKKYTIDYLNSNDEASPLIITPNSYAKYYIGIGTFLASLIAIYKYYPELFENVSFETLKQFFGKK